MWELDYMGQVVWKNNKLGAGWSQDIAFEVDK